MAKKATKKTASKKTTKKTAKGKTAAAPKKTKKTTKKSAKKDAKSATKDKAPKKTKKDKAAPKKDAKDKQAKWDALEEQLMDAQTSLDKMTAKMTPAKIRMAGWMTLDIYLGIQLGEKAPQLPDDLDEARDVAIKALAS